MELNSREKGSQKSKTVVLLIILSVLAVCVCATYFIVATVVQTNNKSCKIFINGSKNYEITLNSSGKVEKVASFSDVGTIYLVKENFAGKSINEVMRKIAKVNKDLSVEDSGVVVFNCCFESDHYYNAVKSDLQKEVNKISSTLGVDCKLKTFSKKEYKSSFGGKMDKNYNFNAQLTHYEDVFTQNLKSAVENKSNVMVNLITILTGYAVEGDATRIVTEDFENAVVNLTEFARNFNYDLSAYDCYNLSYDDVFKIVSAFTIEVNNLNVLYAGLDSNYNLSNYAEFTPAIKKVLIQSIAG